MPQTQDTTPHPVTVYRHGANLSLCYPSMWNVTLEYTATHFNVLGETRPGNPSPTFHTHQRTFNLMLSWWSTVGSSVESTVPTGSWTRDLWCANPVRYPLAHSDFLWTSLHVVMLGWCLLVAVVLWPTCWHTRMPCHRHRTWQPIPSLYRRRTWHPIPSLYRRRTWLTPPPPSHYTDTGHDTPPRHIIQTQDMTPHPVTVYRHRTWHPTPSQYTDTGHDTPLSHSIQTQDMTPHSVTVYRHRTWHPSPSQYTDTGHDTPLRHSIQTQDMTPHSVTVYRHRTWHPTPSQYTDTGHDTPLRHSIQTQDMTLHPSQYTDTGHDNPPRHSIQTQDTTTHLVTVYRHRTWHPTPSQYTDTGHDIPLRHSIQTQDMTPHPVTVYRHEADLSLCYPQSGTSRWKSQLPVWMSWVWPNQEILPRPSTQVVNVQIYDAVMVAISQKSVESVPYTYPPSREPMTFCVWIHFAVHSATAASSN